jgi:iron complex outermembrane receptor protein
MPKAVNLLFQSHMLCLSVFLVTLAVPAYADVTANSRGNRGEILSQVAENETIEVTRVKVNSTDKGLEIILETKQGDKLQVLSKNDGDSFIADIPNAQLRLPQGNTFTQEKPAAGINTVTVTNVDTKSIRVTVTGEISIPKVELFDDDDGLVFAVTSIAPVSSSQQPESPKKPDETKPTSEKPSEPVAETIEVTGVKVNSTDKGLEIILETKQGDKLQVLSKNDGDSFIADIPNAQLRLPQGNTFTQEKPAAGINTVTVTNVDTKSIRVTVTGEISIPKVELFDDDDGLVFAVTSIAPVSSPQQPESPKKPDETKPTSEKPSEPVAETDEPEPIELVVTAQKTEENLQDVPVSVTAISEREIEDAGITNIQGIANNTPNFTVLSASGGRFFSFYSLRGLSNSNFLSRSDTVSFYIDDIPLEGGFNIEQELIDLERVEVLRGPQSTLYGRNAQAGVVNIISRKPTNNPEIRTSAAGGSYNGRDLQLSLSNAIIPDKLFFRLSGGYKARDGFGRNTLTDENLGEQSSISGRGQILWTPSPAWTISVNAAQTYNDDSGYGYASITAKNRYDAALNESGNVELNDNSQALRIAYDSANFRFTTITSHRNSTQDSRIDGDISPIDIFRNVNNFSTDIWSQEIRLQSPTDEDKFRWIVGGYYEAKNVDYLELYKLTPISQALFGAFDTRRLAAESSGNIYAAFAQVDYKPVQPLTLTAGLRYEYASTTLTRSNNFEVAGVAVNPAGQTFIDAETSSSVLLPKVGLEYRFNPNLMVYTSITRGYKPGGLNYRADVPGSLIFAPEKSWNYEAGLKSSWLDDKLIANLALFSNQLENYQAALPDPVTGIFSSITNASASINGAEFELKAKPNRGLELSAGFGYNDAKYNNYTNPLIGSNFNGNRLPLSPEYTYNLAAQYRTTGGLLGRLELQGFGSYLLDDANRIKQDPFLLVNARVGYEKNNFGFYLFANNIFDTRYITQGFEFPPPSVIASYGAPVTVGIQVRANF